MLGSKLGKSIAQRKAMFVGTRHDVSYIKDDALVLKDV
jgi:hypothetical protein